jgi:hypothetical protein
MSPPAFELFEDPAPRLALLLLCYQALLVYRIPWDIHPRAQILVILARATIIVAANIRIAVAQITTVIAAGRLTPLRRKRLGMHSAAMLGSGTRRILIGLSPGREI